jgi:DUF1365 family protein
VGIEQSYDWRFTGPSNRLFVHMENFENGAKLLEPTMNLERHEIWTASLAGTRPRHRSMTAQVIGVICFATLRLCWWHNRLPVNTDRAKLAAKNP